MMIYELEKRIDEDELSELFYLMTLVRIVG